MLTSISQWPSTGLLPILIAIEGRTVKLPLDWPERWSMFASSPDLLSNLGHEFSMVPDEICVLTPARDKIELHFLPNPDFSLTLDQLNLASPGKKTQVSNTPSIMVELSLALQDHFRLLIDGVSGRVYCSGHSFADYPEEAMLLAKVSSHAAQAPPQKVLVDDLLHRIHQEHGFREADLLRLYVHNCRHFQPLDGTIRMIYIELPVLCCRLLLRDRSRLHALYHVGSKAIDNLSTVDEVSALYFASCQYAGRTSSFSVSKMH